MKRTFNLLVGLILLGIIQSGCQKENFEEPDSLNLNFLKSDELDINYCGDPVVNDLIADEDLVVGSVTVGNNGETLFVTIETSSSEEWLIANTKLFVGSADAMPLTKDGNPVLGKFIINDDHDPYVKSITYEFSLDELDPEFVVATHADVVLVEEKSKKTVVTREEGAWGMGDGIFTESQWGWYLNYSVQSCVIYPKHVVIFRDILPWNQNAQEAVLNGMGLTPGTGLNQYKIITFDRIPTYELDPKQDLVIITAYQYYPFIMGHEDYFYDFVKAGGSLLWECHDITDGNLYYNNIKLPGGVTISPDNDYKSEVYIANPTLPFVSGLPSPLAGNPANKYCFANLPYGTIWYSKDYKNNPTSIELHLGDGLVILTTLMLEANYAWSTDENMKEMLQRFYSYMIFGEVRLPE